MNFVGPKNIFSAIFAASLPEELKQNFSVQPSSMLSKELETGKADIGFIPSCDLINHKDFFVSKKIAISFDGLLSNSYIYFAPEKVLIKDVLLRGDVSVNEIILSKILFSERFNSEVDISLDTASLDLDNKNYIIAGNDNFDKDLFNTGTSFADNMAEMLDFPYVNYVLAAKDESAITAFTKNLTEWDKRIEDKIDPMLSLLNLPADVIDFIKMNLNSVYFEMTDNEITALNELLNVIYYRGIIDDIIETKLI